MKSARFSAFFALFLLLFPVSALSERAIVKVVGITDGDTVKVLFEGNRLEKVRLDQVDAPERHQAFGRKSRQYLAGLVHGKHVTLEYQGRDRYGRIIGELLIDGKSVNAEMVRAGMAWVYRRYMRDETLLLLEGAARQEGRGLWSEPEPVAPWNFRRGAREPRLDFNSDAHSECLPEPRCADLPDCDAARFQLRQCGADRLDGDGDGVPCEAICR